MEKLHERYFSVMSLDAVPRGVFMVNHANSECAVRALWRWDNTSYRLGQGMSGTYCSSQFQWEIRVSWIRENDHRLNLVLLSLQAFNELEEQLKSQNICIAIKEKLTKDSGVAAEDSYDAIIRQLLSKQRARGLCVCSWDRLVIDEHENFVTLISLAFTIWRRLKRNAGQTIAFWWRRWVGGLCIFLFLAYRRFDFYQAFLWGSRVKTRKLNQL